jgi:hypothetical protein
MTHNIWNRDKNSPDWEEKGFDCSAEARVGGLLRVWQETQPDVIGCQESSALMADLVKEGMPDYTLIWGRFTPILYRADKLELVDSEFLTYPEYIEGFEGKFNDAGSKSCNLGVFRCKEDGKLFIFATTHLWWMEEYDPKIKYSRVGSDRVRTIQLSMACDMIKKYAKKYNCPAILGGDLNTYYRSEAIQTALASGFDHAHDVATDYADDTNGWHHCGRDGFVPMVHKPFSEAIDHILVHNAPNDLVVRFDRYTPDYYVSLSDHSPVFVDIKL